MSVFFFFWWRSEYIFGRRGSKLSRAPPKSPTMIRLGHYRIRMSTRRYAAVAARGPWETCKFCSEYVGRGRDCDLRRIRDEHARGKVGRLRHCARRGRLQRRNTAVRRRSVVTGRPRVPRPDRRACRADRKTIYRTAAVSSSRAAGVRILITDVFYTSTRFIRPTAVATIVVMYARCTFNRRITQRKTTARTDRNSFYDIIYVRFGKVYENHLSEIF